MAYPIATRGGRGSGNSSPYVPALGDLVLSGALVAGVASSGTVLNATAGSTIASTVSGLTVNSAARTYTYNGTGAAGSTNNGLTETLAGATFSPRGNVVTIVSSAVPAFTSNPSISPQGGNVGGTFSGIDGAMSNGGSILSRRWILNGTSIGSGTTVVPASAGSLVFENTGTGNVVATSTPVTVAAANPTLALSPTSPSVASNAASGTLVSNISNVPAGATPTVTPNDGRLVIAGDASAGWKVVVGMSALSAGTVNFLVAATGATGASGALTVTAAATPTLKPLMWTNLQRVGFESSTMTSDRRYRQRSLHLTGFRAKRFRLAFPSWGKPGGESVTPVAFTIEKVAVEINGGYLPVTFNGGSASGIVDPSVDLLFSDWIDTSKLIGGVPLGENFPRDAEMYVRMKAVFPTGVVVPRGTLSRGQNQTNQFYDPADEGITSDVYGTGIFTGSPTSATIPTGGSGLSFFIIADPVEAGAKAAIAAGDSIMYGAADSAWGSSGLSNKVGFGAWDRATADADGKNVLALVHMSQAGEKQDQWMSRINRGKSILPFVNIALDEFGTNDIGGTTSVSRTLDQMKTTRLAFWKLMRDNGIERVLTTTLPPRVVGQGADYSTPEGQTYVTSRWAPGGQKDLFEQWLATQVGTATGTDALIDIYAPVKAAADPFKWGGPFTSDGCHPLSSGHIRIAVPLRTAWLALTVNGVATVPVGPTNTAPSVISGTAEVGQTLTRTTAGTYSATPTSLTGQWRKDSSPISGATDTTYTLVAGDVGALGIDYLERAVFADGTAVSTASNPIGPVTAAGAPANTARPAITGTAEVAKVLTVSDGTWTNSPTSYSYQWRADTVVIIGATAKTYTLTNAEQDKVIDCEVTATNAAGSRSRLSTSVGPVVAAAGGTPSGTVLFNDTFTADPAATEDPLITARTSDSGQTWVRNAAIGQTGASMRISRALGVTLTSTVPVEYEVASFTLPSADFNIIGGFSRRSANTTNAMMLFRRLPGANRGYGLMYNNTAAEWRLYRFGGTGGADAIVGTYAAAIAGGLAEVRTRGATITVLIDDVQRISFTDPDPILDAGTIGHRISGNGSTDTTGVSLTSLKVLAA